MAVVSNFDIERYSDLKDFLDRNDTLKKTFKKRYFDIDVEDWIDKLNYFCMDSCEAIYKLVKYEDGIHIVYENENNEIVVIKFYEEDIV